MEYDMQNFMDNLVQYLLFELKKRNMPITEFNMQKLIYKIKMELGKEHELYPKLPYYWYLKGPYSEVVSRSFNNSQIFNVDNLDINSDILRFPEVGRISDELMSDKEFFYNVLDKEIYKQYAPYDCMYSYKYEIYDVVKRLNHVDFDVEDFLRKMTHCEGRLPFNEYFNLLCLLYSELTIYLDLINDVGNFEKNWDFLRKPIICIWKTFAKGFRVKFHDDFYSNNVKIWDGEYRDSLADLSYLVKQTKNFIDFEEYPYKEYTPEEIKMLNVTIGGYLRR